MKRTLPKAANGYPMALPVAILLSASLLVLQSASAQPCGNSAGPQDGSSFANLAFPGSTLGWSNPSYAQSNDGNYASSGATLGILTNIYSDYLEVTGFGFNIPTGATICEIDATVLRHANVTLGLGAQVSDQSVRIIKNGALAGSEMAKGGGWPTSDAAVTYGPSTALWGTTWLPSDINASNFGVAIATNLSTGLVSLNLSAQINEISITVYYSVTTLGLGIQQFSATRQVSGNQLSWTASSLAAGGQFILQRSADAKSWSSLASLDAVATATDTNYTYLDPAPFQGTNFYRLQLSETGGSGSWSSVVEVADPNSPSIQVYPNPASDHLTISSPVPLGFWRITDLQGKTLRGSVNSQAAGSWQIPLAGLPSGLYLVQADGYVYKFVKK